jgi:hypothetical protein
LLFFLLWSVTASVCDVTSRSYRTWALGRVTELMSRFATRYACLGKSHARSHLVLVSRI